MGHETFDQTADLVIRIGFSASPDFDLSVKGKILETVNSIFQDIRNTLNTFTAQSHGLYKDASPKLRLISSFANGPEQWVSVPLLDDSLELQCILPIFKDEYRASIQDTEAIENFDNLWEGATEKLELDGLSREHKPSMQHFAQILLNQADILIAIWNENSDKDPDRAYLVEKAVKRNIPVILINPESDPISCLWQKNERSGELPVRMQIEELPNRLKNIFLLAADIDPEGDSLRSFLSERQPVKLPIFRRFRDTLATGWNKEPLYGRLYKEILASNWNSTSAPNRDIGEKIDSKYNHYFERTDELANAYGETHRSFFVLTYTLGALAVLTAFFGIYLKIHMWFKVELALIMLILLLVILGSRRRLHERWIDYRLLGEGFRQMKYLAAIGRVTPVFEIPAYLDHDDPGRTWFNGYFQAIIRKAGMLSAKFDPEFLNVYRSQLEQAVQEQINYHVKNYLKLNLIHERLHHFVVRWLFPGTLLACITHLIPEEQMEHWAGNYYDLLELLLSLLAIVLPAVGAAIEGIIHQGEFERIARRSKALNSRLLTLRDRLANTEKQFSSEELGSLAEYFCQIQLLEQADWRAAFVSKPLSLAF